MTLVCWNRHTSYLHICSWHGAFQSCKAWWHIYTSCPTLLQLPLNTPSPHLSLWRRLMLKKKYNHVQLCYGQSISARLARNHVYENRKSKFNQNFGFPVGVTIFQARLLKCFNYVSTNWLQWQTNLVTRTIYFQVFLQWEIIWCGCEWNHKLYSKHGLHLPGTQVL